MDDISKRLKEIKEEIDRLPAGSVGKKTVKGRVYYYHRWNENGKRREKYIPASELESFRMLIDRRKSLQDELRSLSALSADDQYSRYSFHGSKERRSAAEVSDIDETGSYGKTAYRTNVLTGDGLALFASGAAKYTKRELYNGLTEYLYGDHPDRILILYGLRRTGKTTMIRQAVNEMDAEDIRRTAFIQITGGNTLADVNSDLRRLLDDGFRYVFIDEVTLMDDFIGGSALLPDIYAASGMKIVLSGTDSLGFLFARDEQLYDRCEFIHTTFIPYSEFESVLGIKGVDEYIRFGGTMSLGGRDYNRASTFASKQSTDEYIDSSIARNIRHSLKHYQYGGHFRSLQELYDKDELTGAVNRVVEDINHRFTVETLTRPFRSHDLGVSAANLRRDRNKPDDILDRIDTAKVTERLADLLEIRNREDQRVRVSDIHAFEIKQYLDLLELTADIDVVDIDHLNDIQKRTVIAQPGLRYSQADALVASLLQDETFADLSAEERKEVLERIRGEIRGRMLEEIILLETSKAFADKHVFTLKFEIGEFDMVVADPESLSCEIYEIKHSRERDAGQTRHLLDEEKCRRTEFRYGKITGRYVLYRGEQYEDGEVRYFNAEDYLKGLYGQKEPFGE